MSDSVAEQMRKAQFQWSQAEAVARRERDMARVAKSDADRARRVQAEIKREEEAKKERAAARDKHMAEVSATAEKELKQRMRLQFLTQPGSTPEAFERLWPRLLEEHQLEAMRSGAGDTAAEYRAYRSRVGLGRVDM